MTTEPLTIAQIGVLEQERLKANIVKYHDTYAYANDTLSLMSVGMIGFKPTHRAFGTYYTQISITVSLALLSALRQHRTQIYSNLRHALEHTALAAYALANPEDPFFEKDASPEAEELFLKKTAYPWLDKHHAGGSAEIKRIKALINRDHAHAALTHARRNLKFVENDLEGMTIDFFDAEDFTQIHADLFHTGYVGMLALSLITTINRTKPAIRWVSDFGAEYMRLFREGDEILSRFGAED